MVDQGHQVREVPGDSQEREDFPDQLDQQEDQGSRDNMDSKADRVTKGLGECLEKLVLKGLMASQVNQDLMDPLDRRETLESKA